MAQAPDFLAELTQHIPLNGLQLVRRHGLYASRDRCVSLPPRPFPGRAPRQVFLLFTHVVIDILT